jgi:glycerol-3-phosphate acyltransferase PlsX
MSIILDAMGSDHHPDPEVSAAVTAAQRFGEEILLVGPEELLKSKLAALPVQDLPVQVVDAPDVLEMNEHPVEASRKKPRNSMAVGIELLKEGRGRAFVSMGNTGAVMFNALRILGRVEGVERPALTALFPTRTGNCVIIDLGANVDCRPEFLVQFAIMGSLYAQKVLKIENPRIGLLSNGEEAGKGNDLVKRTYPLLQKTSLNFVGNVEPKEIFAGQADVAVTDGFVGNIMAKTSEALAKFMTDTLRDSIMSSLRTKVGGLLIRPVFDELRHMVNPSEVGAAPLLGLNGLVFVGHGRSHSEDLVSAIRVARQAADEDLTALLRAGIQEGLAAIPSDLEAQVDA